MRSASLGQLYGFDYIVHVLPPLVWRSPQLGTVLYEASEGAPSGLNAAEGLQEKDSPDSKKETRAQYLARLRRTALATPADFINSIMGAMHKRCKLCDDAKGGHFPEGGGN